MQYAEIQTKPSFLLGASDSIHGASIEPVEVAPANEAKTFSLVEPLDEVDRMLAATNTTHEELFACLPWKQSQPTY